MEEGLGIKSASTPPPTVERENRHVVLYVDPALGRHFPYVFFKMRKVLKSVCFTGRRRVRNVK